MRPIRSRLATPAVAALLTMTLAAGLTVVATAPAAAQAAPTIDTVVVASTPLTPGSTATVSYHIGQAASFVLRNARFTAAGVPLTTVTHTVGGTSIPIAAVVRRIGASSDASVVLPLDSNGLLVASIDPDGAGPVGPTPFTLGTLLRQNVTSPFATSVVLADDSFSVQFNGLVTTSRSALQRLLLHAARTDPPFVRNRIGIRKFPAEGDPLCNGARPSSHPSVSGPTTTWLDTSPSVFAIVPPGGSGTFNATQDLTAAHVADARTALDSLTYNGACTAIADAMIAVLNAVPAYFGGTIPPSTACSVFLVTDGEQNAGLAEKVLSTTTPGCRRIVLGLGLSATDPLASELIALAAGGDQSAFVPAPVTAQSSALALLTPPPGGGAEMRDEVVAVRRGSTEGQADGAALLAAAVPAELEAVRAADRLGAAAQGAQVVAECGTSCTFEVDAGVTELIIGAAATDDHSGVTLDVARDGATVTPTAVVSDDTVGIGNLIWRLDQPAAGSYTATLSGTLGSAEPGPVTDGNGFITAYSVGGASLSLLTSLTVNAYGPEVRGNSVAVPVIAYLGGVDSGELPPLVSAEVVVDGDRRLVSLEHVGSGVYAADVVVDLSSPPVLSITATAGGSFGSRTTSANAVVAQPFRPTVSGIELVQTGADATLTVSADFVGATPTGFVNWGDGSPVEEITFDAAGAGTAGHAFAGPTGRFPVTVTLTDSLGGVTKAEAGHVALCLALQAVFAEGPGPFEGTDGDDVVLGSDLSQSILTHDGDDVVCAERGHDTVRAGRGDDVVVGGDGNDRIDAGAGSDAVDGGDGNDVVVGGIGDDRPATSLPPGVEAGLFGGSGHDSLFGGAGRDRLKGEGGSDLLCGGASGDNLEGRDGTVDEHFGGGQPSDRISADGADVLVDAAACTEPTV